ncbi:MAG: indole-3-glycerol phosphate synthase TrpC [Thermodesulfobacteriota bacterium]
MFLKKIIEMKKDEVQRRKTRSKMKELKEMVSSLTLPRDFLGAISGAYPIAIIAEIKKASPSRGVIKEFEDISLIARQYELGGASAISVLTEVNFFKGNLSYLKRVKDETSIPILQKDFIIDPFQIYEGRAWGADAILLIASILGREELRDFVILIQELQMVPLVEIHDKEDLEKISLLNLPLIGINNRDLKTFQVDLGTTLRLRREIPLGVKVISESGIKGVEDVRLLREAGVSGILVGEMLMRAHDPSSKLKELLRI